MRGEAETLDATKAQVERNLHKEEEEEKGKLRTLQVTEKAMQEQKEKEEAKQRQKESEEKTRIEQERSTKEKQEREERDVLKKHLLNILKKINSYNGAEVFKLPVTFEEAPDYDDVIKYRMDLSTLKKKVLSGVKMPKKKAISPFTLPRKTQQCSSSMMTCKQCSTTPWFTMRRAVRSMSWHKS